MFSLCVSLWSVLKKTVYKTSGLELDSVIYKSDFLEFVCVFVSAYMDWRDVKDIGPSSEVFLQYSSPIGLSGRVKFLLCEIHEEIEEWKFMAHSFL